MAIKALAWMVRTLRAAGLLLPRDRPQQDRRPALRGAGRRVRRRHRRCAAGSPIMLSAHGSAPEVVAAARARGQLRRRLGVSAGHQGAPRGEGACRQGLPHRLRRPRGSRGGRRHDGGRARRDQSRRERRRGRRRSPQFDEPVALLAQTTLSHRDWEGVAVAVRERYPDVWSPGRSDLCFATTNRQSALMAMAATMRCDRGHRFGQLVQHASAREAGQRGRLSAGVPGQRRRRAARRPARHGRCHRRRVGPGGAGRGDHRPYLAPTQRCRA